MAASMREWKHSGFSVDNSVRLEVGELRRQAAPCTSPGVRSAWPAWLPLPAERAWLLARWPLAEFLFDHLYNKSIEQLDIKRADRGSKM